MKTLILLTLLFSQVTFAAQRPIPRAGDELTFTMENSFEQKSKVCLSTFEVKMTAKALNAKEIDVTSTRKQIGGDASCGKAAHARKHWIYHSMNSTLLRVIECKTEDEATCITRDPLPKDEWQDLESLGNCQYIRDEIIGGYSTEYSTCPMTSSAGADATLEFWKNTALYAPYPFVQMRTTILMPAYEVKSIITQTLKSIKKSL